VIEETRHFTGEVYDAEVGRARGILRKAPGTVHPYGHSRRLPAAALRHCVAHYWLVWWDLPPGKRERVETLPHPNIHLVFDGRETLIHGVPTRKFTRLIEGRQGAFGIKFRPGGFHGFLGSHVAELRDRSIHAREVFGKASVDGYESALCNASTEAVKIRAANRFLLEHLGPGPYCGRREPYAAATVPSICRRDSEVGNPEIPAT
jgi:hypothetical protein